MSSVAQDYRSVAPKLMSKICERRQENLSSTTRTTVQVADIVKLFPTYFDPNKLETIIGKFGENTGFYEILGKSIVLTKEGKHECTRLKD